MAGLTRGSALKWLLVVLCLVPVAVFAYLGSFSRLLSDDYVHLLVGRELGPWESMLYWRSIHNGSYAHYFLHGLVAPLDTLVPQVAVYAIIALWMVGAFGLAYHGLSILQIGRDRSKVGIAVAGLIVAAAINALYHPQSFLWYSGSTRYTLPLTVFVVYLAIVQYAATRLRSIRSLTLVAATGAVVCFAFAGLSEMYMVFQLLLLSLLMILVFFLIERSGRRPYVILLGAGWVGTLVSLLVQFSAPGVAIRIESSARRWVPIRSISELVSGVADLTFEYIGHQEAFAGFMMLFAIALFMVLRTYEPSTGLSQSDSVALAGPALWIALFVQICFIPILLTHISDHPQVFGRYSRAFAVVVAINLALVFVLVILSWRRRHIEFALMRMRHGRIVYCSALLLLFVLVFALTQLRSIHYKAATYLFVTAMVCVGALCWQLTYNFPNPTTRKLGLYAMSWLLVTVIVIASLVGLSLYVQGYVSVRIMAGAAFLQVIGGLIWGGFLGVLIQESGLLSVENSVWVAWVRYIRRISFSVFLIACVGISFGHARAIPDLAAFATEWDARHDLMLSYRDMGRTDVEVPPLTVDITRYFCCSNITSSQDATYYYGFKSRDLGRDAD